MVSAALAGCGARAASAPLPVEDVGNPTTTPVTATPTPATPAAPGSATPPGITQPASAQPAAAQPASAGPASAGPALAPPATALPAEVPPATAQPASAQPAAAQPATADAGAPSASGDTEPASSAAPAGTAPNVRSGASVNAVGDVGDPVRVIVPSAGIDGPVSPAGVMDDDTVAVPPDPLIAGWFTGGPRPGELGPAVIVGHVDSKKSGPGVFYRLREAKVGDTATVITTTGSQEFVVVATELVAKDEFPTARVYGQVPIAALRLITCGGSFDRSIGHYRSNVVVYLVKVGG